MLSTVVARSNPIRAPGIRPGEARVQRGPDRAPRDSTACYTLRQSGQEREEQGPRGGGGAHWGRHAFVLKTLRIGLDTPMENPQNNGQCVPVVVAQGPGPVAKHALDPCRHAAHAAPSVKLPNGLRDLVSSEREQWTDCSLGTRGLRVCVLSSPVKAVFKAGYLASGLSWWIKRRVCTAGSVSSLQWTVQC